MERCLECNSLMTKNEKLCPICGKEIGHGKRTIGELLAIIGQIVFYASIATLVVSRFVPSGSIFVFVLCLCTGALIFMMRNKKR